MADVIDYQILGDDLQLVEVELDYGEGVRAEVGTMTYMEDGIEMQTGMGGDLFSGFKRMFTGESFFITTFMNNARTKQSVAFAAPYPGKIVPFDLDQFNGQVLCQKDSFLTGDGMVFVHAGGTVIEKELAAGETLRVDTGCLVAFSTTVDYDIQFVGGFKNALFGGEGLFLAKMTGPGKVYLQSLPFSRLVDRIKRGITFKQSGGEQRGVAGAGGDILKNIISGS